MSHIKTFKLFCSFCRKDITDVSFDYYNNDLPICLQCKEIIMNDPIDELAPIVMFDNVPVLQRDAKVLKYFEKELNLPLPAINLRNFFTEDEVYGYLIEDNQVIGLGLDGADLESISAIIMNLTNLKYLSLKNNSLTEIPDFVNSLTTLEILDVTKNKLSILPSLYNLDKLYHLSFQDNLISNISNLPRNLQTLSGRWNKIKFITTKLPSSLKKINLAQNRLQEIPVHFGNLEQLEELNLYGNKLHKLPEVFTNLKKLKRLILRVNEIENLPRSFENLLSLETLDVEENKLTKLPSFENLEHLKFLNVSKNNLKKIEGLQHCKELLSLDIRDNKFENLELYGLKKLQVLDISYNKFYSLPKGLESKIHLMECIVSGNNISKINKDKMENLFNLTRISLAKNYLETIPDLSKLKHLRELYLNDNNLKEFPEWIKKLDLRVLTLENNDFEEKEKDEYKLEYDSFNSWFD